MPFKADTMHNGSVCIHVRCPGCCHEWELEMAPTEVALSPRPDRRTWPSEG
jgi:hypothetical protein